MERATAFAMSLDKDCSPSPGRTGISSKAGASAAFDLHGPWFLQWPNEARASSDPRKQKDPRDQLLLDRSVQKPGRLLADLTEQVATRAKALAMGQARYIAAERARTHGDCNAALSLLSAAYELLRLAGPDAEELAERASNRAAGVRGDAALLSARRAYANGALELATRLLVESPNGALGLYTEALEPDNVEETSAVLARVESVNTCV